MTVIDCKQKRVTIELNIDISVSCAAKIMLFRIISTKIVNMSLSG